MKGIENPYYLANPWDDQHFPAGRYYLTKDGKTVATVDIRGEGEGEILDSTFPEERHEELLDSILSDCYWEQGKFIFDNMEYQSKFSGSSCPYEPTEEEKSEISKLYHQCWKMFAARRAEFFKEWEGRHVELFNSMFEWVSETGDFEYESFEAGDWTFYQCGESDCPIGWHKIASAINLYRKDGVKRVEFQTVDEDGNWDCASEWDDESINGPYGQDFLHDYFAHCGTLEHFKGNAEYALWVAENQEDPLDNWYDGCPTVRAAIDSARAELKYLRKSRKNG